MEKELKFISVNFKFWIQSIRYCCKEREKIREKKNFAHLSLSRLHWKGFYICVCMCIYRERERELVELKIRKKCK